MKTLVFALTLSLGSAVAPGAAPHQPAARAAGHWEGTMDTPGQSLDIVVDLAGRADGMWEGTITIPAQGVKGLPLSPVAVNGATVTFGLKGIPGDPVFTGTIASEAGTMAGTLRQGEVEVPFTLARKGEPVIQAPVRNAAIAKDLEGSWEGALSVEGSQLRVAFELANADDCGTGTMISLDQGGTRIPITRISQTGSRVTLMVDAIGASFDGSLGSGVLDGTWTQGHRHFPLTLKRASR